jgi:hypothetical protein
MTKVLPGELAENVITRWYCYMYCYTIYAKVQSIFVTFIIRFTYTSDIFDNFLNHKISITK